MDVLLLGCVLGKQVHVFQRDNSEKVDGDLSVLGCETAGAHTSDTHSQKDRRAQAHEHVQQNTEPSGDHTTELEPAHGYLDSRGG